MNQQSAPRNFTGSTGFCPKYHCPVFRKQDTSSATLDQSQTWKPPSAVLCSSNNLPSKLAPSLPCGRHSPPNCPKLPEDPPALPHHCDACIWPVTTFPNTSSPNQTFLFFSTHKPHIPLQFPSVIPLSPHTLFFSLKIVFAHRLDGNRIFHHCPSSQAVELYLWWLSYPETAFPLR